MQRLYDIAVDEGLVADIKAIHNLVLFETDEIFNVVFPKLLGQLYGDLDPSNERRANEIMVGTLYNKIVQNNRQNN